jgi:hypothetical protein
MAGTERGGLGWISDGGKRTGRLARRESFPRGVATSLAVDVERGPKIQLSAI